MQVLTDLTDFFQYFLYMQIEYNSFIYNCYKKCQKLIIMEKIRQICQHPCEPAPHQRLRADRFFANPSKIRQNLSALTKIVKQV